MYSRRVSSGCAAMMRRLPSIHCSSTSGETYSMPGHVAIVSGSSGPRWTSSRLCVGTIHAPAATVSAASAGKRDSSTCPARFVPNIRGSGAPGTAAASR